LPMPPVAPVTRAFAPASCTPRKLSDALGEVALEPRHEVNR
jgi:hypothetical protein